MTVSPDASGQAIHNSSTPTPADAAVAVPENDPDAHLVDVADESWGMLLSLVTASQTSSSTRPTLTSLRDTVAEGMLFRRGTASSGSALGALGVSLYWDIRVRPGGALDEGPSRQAENTLREVLRMYRNLGLLARLRNLGGHDGDDVMPLHMACAGRGAKALNGFLH